MCALLRKLIKDKDDLWTFAGLVIIAANAGGAWSPIGDVTTIMLWIGGQVTTLEHHRQVDRCPAWCACCCHCSGSVSARRAPWSGPGLQGEACRWAATHQAAEVPGLLPGPGHPLGVPVFKSFTHLPPFMGIMLGLGVLWVVHRVHPYAHPAWRARPHAGHQHPAPGGPQQHPLLPRDPASPWRDYRPLAISADLAQVLDARLGQHLRHQYGHRGA